MKITQQTYATAMAALRISEALAESDGLDPTRFTQAREALRRDFLGDLANDVQSSHPIQLRSAHVS